MSGAEAAREPREMPPLFPGVDFSEMLCRDFPHAADAFIITDEVYEHVVYKPHEHTCMAGLPGMFERTISCSSLSKTCAVTGWRLGYVIASPEVIAPVQGRCTTS